MSNGLISIIIPVYNAEKYIHKTLSSILEQSFDDWELILVNDGSTDKTENIVQQFIKENSDRTIQYFKQENAGPSVARNKGIKIAKGEYLCFVDADDWIIPKAIEFLWKAMQNNPVELVCAGYFEINEKFPNGLALHDFDKKSQNKIVDKNTYQEYIFKGVAGVLWAKLFKKEIFSQYTIELNPKIKLSEDLLAVIEYSKYIKNVFVLNENIYYYNRLDEEGLSRKLQKRNLADLRLTNQLILSFKNDIAHIDVNTIIQNRENQFILQYLKQHIQYYTTFKQAVSFINDNFEEETLSIYKNAKGRLWWLSLVYNKKYFTSFILLKIEEKLRKGKKYLKL